MERVIARLSTSGPRRQQTSRSETLSTAFGVVQRASPCWLRVCVRVHSAALLGVQSAVFVSVITFLSPPPAGIRTGEIAERAGPWVRTIDGINRAEDARAAEK